MSQPHHESQPQMPLALGIDRLRNIGVAEAGAPRRRRRRATDLEQFALLGSDVHEGGQTNPVSALYWSRLIKHRPCLRAYARSGRVHENKIAGPIGGRTVDRTTS